MNRLGMNRLARGYAIFLMFSALAYSFWFNLGGVVGAGIPLFGTTAITAAVVIITALRNRRDPDRRNPDRLRRRHPWLVYAYLALATLSLIWSAWPIATVLTLCLLGSSTLQAVWMSHRFSRTELLELFERALAIVLTLSVLIELWVAAILRHPLLPNFSDAPADPDPHWFWVRGNLLDGVLSGGRIQGIVGNANLLAAVCVLALIVFATRLAHRAPHAPVRWVFAALALWLCLRAGSATMFVTLAALGLTALLVLLLRRLSTRRARVTLYAGIALAIAAAGTVFLLATDTILGILGRSSDFTGRGEIWAQVLARALESPVIGNGFSSPWVPWEPAFAGWIVDHGITVFHAHNMWLDIFFQLGAIGVLIVAALYLITGWRAWRFAVNRTDPAWSLAPLLFVLLLAIQGLTESTPLIFWGWMLITVLNTTLPRSPLQSVRHTRPNRGCGAGRGCGDRGVVRSRTPSGSAREQRGH